MQTEKWFSYLIDFIYLINGFMFFSLYQIISWEDYKLKSSAPSILFE